MVTTPARAAQKVAVRAVGMARKSYLRVAGVIENMSAFTCEHGESYALFGEGGGEQLAHDAGVPLLGAGPARAVGVGRRRRGRRRSRSATAPRPRRSGRSRRSIVDEAVPLAAMAGCSARMLDAAVAALDAADAGR